LGLLSKIASAFGFGTPQEAEPVAIPSHALIVEFDYGLRTSDRLHALDDKLQEHFSDAFPIEYDGYEIATDLSCGTLYFYGSDADLLLEAVLPELISVKFMKGARLKRRYGEADDDMAREEVISL
jgi:hypothetical protein